MHNEVQQKVYEELQQALNIYLTTDIWTSQANQAYMTITAHFIDLKNNKIKNVVLVILEHFGAATRKLASDSSPILSIILSVLTILITSLEDRSTDSSLLKKIKHILRAYQK
ncbi:unnamed protein product [Rotaria sordida]|uniref:Uncharacterized protein n=1 Tax=Rotaria sordida TaxID=392033 RepID=A0A816FS63_9BILA|nr:unnamed protein product [Rotaria sordida]CAF1665111.1 unnamed protein product [Rotaria sordida]